MAVKATLKRITYPQYGRPSKVGPASASCLESRIDALRKKMSETGLTHAVVYGDREHFANICYLTDFDPRFEEALLIVGETGAPLILVGNEGVGHLGVSALYKEGKMRYERYQTFSLQSQPKSDSRPLETIFREEGICSASTVGVIGWKYYQPEEFSDSIHVSDVPAYIFNLLTGISGDAVNATDLMVSPTYGLRSRVTPREIAMFELANTMSCDAVKAMLSSMEPGMTDFELMSKVPFTGYPMSCHPSVKSSGNTHYGLSSPTGDTIRRGDPCSMSIAYWGSNVCRAGWVVKDETELPETAAGYVENFVAPFMLAVREWLRHMKIGVPGSEIYDLIQEMLPFDSFGVFLNPGHIIHYDEWPCSPIYKGSEETLQSGMCMQIDIIPKSKAYSSSRMEEGIVIADQQLRDALRSEYPEVYSRCMQRRAFMESLGFELPEEVLPLSDLAGIVAPYLLDKENVICFVKE